MQPYTIESVPHMLTIMALYYVTCKCFFASIRVIHIIIVQVMCIQI